MGRLGHANRLEALGKEKKDPEATPFKPTSWPDDSTQRPKPARRITLPHPSLGQYSFLLFALSTNPFTDPTLVSSKSGADNEENGIVGVVRGMADWEVRMR
nr:hypothetical protein L204_01403 [Cryptococcus depauperatus CBS 7855]